MDRTLADQQIWQFVPFRVELEARRFIGVEPFCPAGVRVDADGDRFVIHGVYGFDVFTDHRFTVRIGSALQVFQRLEDIPERFDNLIAFTPDPTHDRTFEYRFEGAFGPIVHRHWIHHDMEPWIDVQQQLLTRETNGGHHARSDAHRRRGYPALLGDDPNGRLPNR